MNTLAHEGPGPRILLFPLPWAVVVLGVVTVLRRTGVWHGGTGRRGPGQERAPYGESPPIAMPGRRFASGGTDEEEYWRRLSVLDGQFGRTAWYHHAVRPVSPLRRAGRRVRASKGRLRDRPRCAGAVRRSSPRARDAPAASRRGTAWAA